MAMRSFATVSVAIALLAIGSTIVAAETVTMYPAQLNLALDDGAAGGADEGRISVRLNDFPKVWGVELYVTYDASKVEVLAVDAGACPAPEINIHQDFKNLGSAGLVRYTVSSLNSGPCSAVGQDMGVEAFSILFHRIAPGDAKLDFSLAKPSGISIVTDANVAVCDHRTPHCWQGATISAAVSETASAID